MHTLMSEVIEAVAAPARTDVPALLYYAALLAGMGPQAQAVADEQEAVLRSPAGDGRSCIDGGSPLMFSLLAPVTSLSERRALRVLARNGPARGGVLPWLRTYYLPDGHVERWHTLTYIGEPGSAWEHARSAAERAGGLDDLRRMHALLGPYSRLYSVNWTVDDTAPQAWVGWQLDRGFAVDGALALLGCSQLWPQAAALWEALLGYPPRPGRGPWSISLLLGGEPRLRLGSTNWARCPEEPDKRRRLATVIERHRGERRFAESLYKLVESATHPGRLRAVGRAVELELADSQTGTVEFYICVP